MVSIITNPLPNVTITIINTYSGLQLKSRIESLRNTKTPRIKFSWLVCKPKIRENLPF